MHMYTRMDNLTDNSTDNIKKGFKDVEISLKRCKGLRDTVGDWDLSGTKLYCPQFNESHFLYGGYFSERYSWMRVILHFCDESPKAE